ncbi:MAG TPA: hypothetical protein DD622_06265 [Opitutae bacterium]|nr:hypothetical protein [Opitutae bacterium]|tara:strand:- start:4773 stop:5552 length:780 start_codon:yes stop_codon:yes gene_type:complete
MHLSFDLYPSYFRNFSESVLPKKEYQLSYAIHAMRNYTYRTEGGKRTGPFPQVRQEGSLVLNCPSITGAGKTRQLNVVHTRAWSTWTGQKPSSKQTINASIKYASNHVGSLEEWNLSYKSEPILPVKSYRYNALGPVKQYGRCSGPSIEVSSSKSGNIRTYTANHTVTSLYTLIERLQAGAVQLGKVDYFDDLTMFRPGLEIVSLPQQKMEIQGKLQNLHGYALVGPAILPLYFWQDELNHVLAVIGRNVAYTLTTITS